MPSSPRRVYDVPAKVLDKSAPHWTGDTAARVMTKRVKQYEKDKRMKAKARKRKTLAARRARA